TTSANAASDIPGHANFITEADSPYDWRVPQSPNQATLWAGANGGSNNPCPTGWHVPTQPEWATVAGYFSPQTSVGAFNSSLKLPLAGHRRRGDAALSNRGSTGSYWSSSPSGTEASNLAFNSGVVTPAGIGNRAYGFSVRCVKDDDAAAPIIPTIALTGAAIASPYTESDANTRFPSGLQFDVTNAVSATVNGGAPVSLAGGVLTAVSNADAKTAASHSYYVVVTSSDGHTAEMTISYTVGSVFACGSSTVQGAGGLTYGTVVGPDGKCWLDRNLGATQVATSASDANAYGYYYQWGRLTDGHQVSNSGVTSTNSGSDIPGHANFITEDTSPYDWRVPQSPNEATLWAGVSGGSNNPCPTDWHVPTQSEWGTLAGYFSPQTSVGAFNSTLKLPLAGTRNRNSAALLHRGIFGYYWSSSPSGSNASSPYFGSGGVFPAFADGRAAGFSVRCVKDDTVAPTIALSGAAIASPYTTYYANLRFPSGLQFDVTNAVSATVNGGAPVSLAGGVLTAVSNADAKTLGDHSYHVVVTSSDSHTAEMTITYHVDANSPFACGSTVDFTYKGNSVSYGTVEHNGECWMDRNLGASQVATAYNDSSAYGDLFQWGRLDDGHQTRTSGVTTTLSNTDSPGHSNFIIGPYDSDWRSPRNDNLWQGASAVNSPCPSGWRVPTEAEWVIEKNSWVNGAFASPLKLAASGGRNYGGGYISGTGENGWYWSSTAWVKNARYLAYFGSNSGSIYVDFRNNGYSVRCIKE
ncbi:MAG: FISUMP domain-containing protein, partial [Candidatus Paceibacterota bacterium]